MASKCEEGECCDCLWTWTEPVAIVNVPDGPGEETVSRYHMRGEKFRGNPVIVRQLCSQGLSFQLWPAAHALCSYLENEFGEAGMWGPAPGQPLLLAHVSRPQERGTAGKNNSLEITGRSATFGANLTINIPSVSNRDDSTSCNVTSNSILAEKIRSVELECPSAACCTATNNIDNNNNVYLDGSRNRRNRTLDTEGRQRNSHERTSPDSRQQISIDRSLRVDAREPTLSDQRESCQAHLDMYKRHPQRRMRVLELGSGTGMVGIVAACMGADVVLTDLSHVIPNIVHNLELNRGLIEAAGGRAEARVLRWGLQEDGHPEVTADVLASKFDLVLASDCVYHEISWKPLLQTLEMFMSATGRTDVGPPHDSGLRNRGGEEAESRGNSDCITLLAHLRRWKKDSRFFKLASRRLDSEVAYRHPPDESSRVGPIVYRFSKKSVARRCESVTSSKNHLVVNVMTQ